MSTKFPRLWGGSKDGKDGFVVSHVKAIYYNWAQNILLSDKLDEMDALIEAKVSKAMMSNQQVNDANKVPTAALTYAMGQDITTINSKFQTEGEPTNVVFGASGSTLGYLKYLKESGFSQLNFTQNGLNLVNNTGSGNNTVWQAALKSDLNYFSANTASELESTMLSKPVHTVCSFYFSANCASQLTSKNAEGIGLAVKLNSNTIYVVMFFDSYGVDGFSMVVGTMNTTSGGFDFVSSRVEGTLMAINYRGIGPF